MSEPVTWLDVVILLAVYLVACGLYKAILAFLAARDVLTEDDAEDDTWTGGEAAPERPDGDSAEPTRAVCNPAASSPDDCVDPACPFRKLPHAHDAKRALPVDPIPVADGNVCARQVGNRWHGYVISEARPPNPQMQRYAAHFGTCSDRNDRRTRKPAPEPAPTLFDHLNQGEM